MLVFFSRPRQQVEQINCDAVDIILEHIVVRVRNSGVQVVDKDSKEVLYDKNDIKGGV